jgi:hypothetical protein
MLSQDPLLLPALTAKRRYAPPFLAAAAYLFTSTLREAAFAFEVSLLQGFLVLAAAAAAAPTCVLLAVYLWQHKRLSEWALLVTAPLNVLPALFSVSPAARLLAGGAMLGAVLQGVAMRRTRRAGAKLI